MLLRFGYVLFLPKSSCVWSMLAADASAEKEHNQASTT
jgi:hypothetical protein